MVSVAILVPIATIASMPSPERPLAEQASATLDDRRPGGSGATSRLVATRRLLIVAYHFPPDAEVGAIRPQKLVKYLPECGWDPLVLTVDPRHHAAHDPARSRDVTGARVWRTGEIPNPRTLALSFRNALRRYLRSGPPDSPAPDLPFDVKNAEASGPRDRLRRLILSLCWLPDANLGWLFPALRTGLAIIRRERPRVILTTSPPATAHLVGLWLSRLTGVPWVADFRDPWAGDAAKPRFVRSPLSDALDRRMERTVIRTASAVLVTTDRLGAKLMERYPEVDPRKFTTLSNGFDPEDFAAVPVPTPSANFLVTHVGSLYHRRSPVAFLQAAAVLVRSGEIPISDLRIAFVGSTLEDGHNVRQAVSTLGLDAVVEEVGRVPHVDAIGWMRRSRLLLLLAQDWPLQVPAKAFEYLASGVPILAIAQSGATADLVAGFGGAVADDTVAEITPILRQRYLAYKAGTTAHGPGDRGLSSFDRRHLAASLGRRLDAIVSQDQR